MVSRGPAEIVFTRILPRTELTARYLTIASSAAFAGPIQS